MTIDFLQLADCLQDELRQFCRVARQTTDPAARQTAAARLQAAVDKVESFSYAPGEEQWRTLCESQRWGYLRLESYVGTAVHELRQWQRTIREGPDSRLASSGSGEEVHFA
jgi:hypothetical protein